MKILFFDENIGYGGSKKMMIAVANYLSARGHNVTVLTYTDANVLQPLHETIKHEHRILHKHPIKVLRRIEQIIALNSYIRQNRFDIAVAFVGPSNYLLTMASKFTKTKVLLSERLNPYIKTVGYSFFNKAGKLIEWVVNTADAFVFQTEGAQSYYPKKVISKSIVIPNPVVNINIPNQYQGEREKVIVNVARLDIYQKRQDVLIKAFSKVLPKYPEYKLKLYGDGPDDYALKKLAGELNITDRVLFMGVSHDVYEDIRKAALFVLSSDFEGIPNALLEAMSVGLPCISTDCSPGGARLLIKDKENGLLVPAENPDEMAKAIEYMLSHPAEATAMSNKALEVVDKYAEDRIYAEWESFIKDVCRR